MSITTQIFWPSVVNNTATIAPAQTVGADHTVKIQSNQPNQPSVPVNNSGVYYYDSMIRKVRLEGSADLSGINFSITGLSYAVDGVGNPDTSTLAVHTETIPGPNTVTQTARLYLRIDSITTNADTGATTVKVGFGTSGITSYVFLNMNVTPPQHWAFQGQPIGAAAGFVYNFYGSLTTPETINTAYGNVSPFPVNIPAFPLLGADATTAPILISNTSNFYNIDTFAFPSLIRLGWARINDASAGGAGSFYFTFYQQGVAR